MEEHCLFSWEAQRSAYLSTEMFKIKFDKCQRRHLGQVTPQHAEHRKDCKEVTFGLIWRQMGTMFRVCVWVWVGWALQTVWTIKNKAVEVREPLAMFKTTTAITECGWGVAEESRDRPDPSREDKTDRLDLGYGVIGKFRQRSNFVCSGWERSFCWLL